MQREGREKGARTEEGGSEKRSGGKEKKEMERREQMLRSHMSQCWACVLWSQLPGSEAWLHNLPATLPWASHPISLCTYTGSPEEMRWESGEQDKRREAAGGETHSEQENCVCSI